MRESLRKYFINYLARNLYRTVTPDELLRRNGRGRLEIKGMELPRENEELLREQANALLNSTLWKYIKDDLTHHAIQKSLHKAETMEDVVSGKLLLYMIDVVESRLDNLRKGL